MEAPRPSVVIDFPRLDDEGIPLGKLRIQVLTMRDHDEARILAHRWLVDKRKIKRDDMNGESIREVYGDAVARELLCMACVSVDPIHGSEKTNTPKYNIVFPDADSLARKVSADELMVLFTSYQMAQHRFGPYEGTIRTEEDLNLWLARLIEGAAALPLAQRTWHQLVELITCLAQRAWSLSVILESQFSGLPDTLKLHLETLGFGTGYFGKPLANITADGSKPSDEQMIDYLIEVARELSPDRDPLAPAEPDPDVDVDVAAREAVPTITLEEATALAQKLHMGG